MDATTLFRHKICARKVGSDLLFDPSFCSSLDGKIISIARDRTRLAVAPVKHLFSFSKTKILTRLFANLIISVKVIFGKTTCSIQTGYLKMGPPRPLSVYFRSFQTQTLQK